MVKIYDLNGKAAGDTELPLVFKTPYRPDVIQRAVLALQSQRRQPYGGDLLAGKRTSAHYHGRRHIDSRQAMMNREMARAPRVHGKSAGWQAWRARFVPQAKGGRAAHPPLAWKIWEQKVNRREHELAIKSGIAASANAELLLGRHTDNVVKTVAMPVVFVDDFENVKKTADVVKAITSVGLLPEIERCSVRKVRAGRGKMRGRKYKGKKGLLFVFARECPALRAAAGLAGADSATLTDLNAELLAPGCQAGRILVTTKGVLKVLDDIFVNKYSKKGMSGAKAGAAKPTIKVKGGKSAR